MSAAAKKRKGLVLALAIVGLLAVPGVAAATPACGVYCEDPAPDPGQRDKPGATGENGSTESGQGGTTESGQGGTTESGQGGSHAAASGGDASGDGSANAEARRAARKLRADADGGKDRVLARALEETAPERADRRRGGGSGSGGGSGDAALAGVGEGGSGLGWLFPALLVATGLWAVVVAVRRRRGSAA